MSNSSIRPIDRTLSGDTMLSQSGSGSDSNEGVLHILQNSSITEALPSDCLVSYPKHLLEESYPSAVMQSVYSAAPADSAKKKKKMSILIYWKEKKIEKKLIVF